MTGFAHLRLLNLEHGVLEFVRDDGERHFAACFAKGVCASQNGESRCASGRWQRGDAPKDDLPLVIKGRREETLYARIQRRDRDDRTKPSASAYFIIVLVA